MPHTEEKVTAYFVLMKEVSIKMQMKIKRTISAFLTAVILLISNSVLAAPANQDIPAVPEETTPPQVITSDVPEPPDEILSTG